MLKKKMQNSQGSDNLSDSDVITSDSGSEDETLDNKFTERSNTRIASGRLTCRSKLNTENEKSNEAYLRELQNRVEKVTTAAQLKSYANVNSSLKNVTNVKQATIIKSKHRFQSLNASSKNKNNMNCMLCIIAIIITVLLVFYFKDSKDFAIGNYTDNTKESERDRVESVLENVFKTLKGMKYKYKNQKLELWKEAYVAIRNIIRDPERPSIIVLLGDKSDPVDCLAILLGNISSNALNSESLLLTPEKFDSDMGTVIESFKLNAQNKKAVIVWDLLNINIEALRAFHNLCDKINPLVKEVIFIITIIADDYDKESNPIKYVQEELFKKLAGKMKKDAIQPLITRITDGAVLAVKPEPNVEDCPLLKATTRI